MQTVVIASRGPSMPIRVLWYLAVGWWLGGLVASCAYLLCLTIIGLPLGLLILNRIPLVLTLRPASETTIVQHDGAQTTVHIGGIAQRAMLLRAVYFVLIGWWLSGLWLGVAYLLQLTIIGIPWGLMMLNRLGGVMTLYRY